MRTHLKLFCCLVTLTLAGCAGVGQSPWQTPSGGSISADRMPDFNQAQRGGQATPMTMASNAQEAGTPAAVPTKAMADLPPVKVALLVPMTGPQGALGQAMFNASQMALFDVGASNITISPHDTNKGAAAAATQAVEEGAQMILGPLFAQDVKAVSPIAAARNVPVIAFSTDWTAATANTYIMGFLPFEQITRVADYARTRNAKIFTALIPKTPYGTAVNVTLQNYAQHNNLTTPQTIVFSNAQLGEAIKKMAAQQQAGGQWAADALVLPLGGPQLAQAATLLRQNDMSMRQTRILGTGLWDDSPQASALLPGGWYAAPDPNLRTKFNGQYVQTYGRPAPRLATLAYDATALASVLAIKGLRENGSPAYDRASLTNPNGFLGLDGVFRFRPDGLVERALAVLELSTTGPVVVDPAPTHF